MKKSLLPFLTIFITFTSCSNFIEPEFKSIENVTVGKLGLNESTLHLDIVYANNNKTKLILKSAEGEAWIDHRHLGHFTVDTLIHIPAKGLFRLPVALKVDLSKILKNSILAFLNPEVMVKVTGKARVGKGGVFINYPIKYEGKQNLRELLK